MRVQMQNVGQVSDDGRWRWDGAQWVPNTALAPNTGGYVVAPAVYQPAVLVRSTPTNSLAVVSMIFGIVSWLICPIVASLVAVITGHSARSQIQRTGEGGSGMAMAGLVLGYINLGIVGLFLLFWLLFFGGLAALGAIGASTSH
jgi:Domain of unknown function (DUF4190)